ncbi:hypothetical protein Kpol_1066p16 [Vanderwaltozyma polyspora DSM 70294]|uniref:Cytokinin riboside 5'-monophosphate phosphoribohydrolase n=1 Tax=Vanderwaltozyma polyspora (strain ATCC 22028 / DSM 70294 / BCRC 21397 / CBS 2163 / NBRC 10782 / NRRL Y-8283 / UCD 57-17) TaxID=436907 RepID=A7TMN8_VANPO|nr:uncharacterized protein Kpol_1066p16 [Vanderwaltozyma polyspora DSM 70294]EDO16452.1 hypothetical protein Kpol_1066p16 [Vanderwaltozyma polyspora DSM 70294]
MTNTLNIDSVCVYCGSSFGNGEKFTEQATRLGELLHKNGWRLVYGGGTTGLMGTIAKATMGPNCDGNVLGIIPDALVSKEMTEDSKNKIDNLNEDLKKSVENHHGSSPISSEYGRTVIVSDMHTRKRLMADESNAFVAMPGGFGTLEEIMECITWSQLGIHSKPIVLFNMDGFYDSLLQFIENSIQCGFISATNGNIIQVATTAEEVIEKLQSYIVPEGRFALDWSINCQGEHELNGN